MLFSSNSFLFLFLPLTILVYYLLAKRFRNLFLLLASLLFYAWGEPTFVFAMLAPIVFNYGMALCISRFRQKQRLAKALLAAAIAGNLGLLFT